MELKRERNKKDEEGWDTLSERESKGQRERERGREVGERERLTKKRRKLIILY